MLLLGGGKQVLIKAAIQVIPMYTMSIFKIPNSLCRDIEKMANDLWWERSQENEIFALEVLEQNV